ncbi:MAG: beta-carotene 3-hydroxylase [Saprospiraceae bacterium]|jgi:beta-carotene 3-hydroxylase
MSSTLLYALVVLSAYVGMEFVAWASHRWLMHGWLWSWHEDHHKPKYEKQGFWEKNDLFFIVFAIPSMFSYIIGSLYLDYRWFLFVGIGISLYGLTYFLIHDVYIHQRFNWFKRLDNKFSRAILKAHGSHHAIHTKEGCDSFGLLVVDPKYFKKNADRRAMDAV